MVDYEFVDYEVRDRAAYVTLQRPEKLNALHEPALEELTDALARSKEDDDLRAVVLQGSGKAFSTGYDIGGGDGVEETDLSVAEWLDRIGTYSHLRAIYEHDLPVIAAVDGYALAGGCNLALVCDLTFASERAKFGYTDVRMGGLPAYVIHPFVVGSIKHARELFYSGKMIEGTEAERMGLVNRTVPHDELLTTVEQEIDQIKKAPGTLVRLTKGMLNDVMEAQGYRPGGRIGEFLATLSVQSEGAEEFYRIRDEEGMEAAIDWMHQADKP